MWITFLKKIRIVIKLAVPLIYQNQNGEQRTEQKQL
jgi:hypothetical protein